MLTVSQFWTLISILGGLYGVTFTWTIWITKKVTSHSSDISSIKKWQLQTSTEHKAEVVSEKIDKKAELLVDIGDKKAKLLADEVNQKELLVQIANGNRVLDNKIDKLIEGFSVIQQTIARYDERLKQIEKH